MMFSTLVQTQQYDSMFPIYAINNPIPNRKSHTPNINLCNCCPYGFHIDLDFVKFAENISTGKEQIQNWSTEPNAKRVRVTSPHFAFGSPDRAKSPLTVDSTRSNFSFIPASNSPFESANSAFVLRNQESNTQPNYYTGRNTTQHYNFLPPSILKNRNMESKIIPQSKFPSVRFTTPQPYKQSHARRFEDHPLNRSNVSVASEYGSYSGLIWTKPRKIAPVSRCQQTSDERANSIPFRQNARIFSAPTSPIPKIFHTAIAQSMAQLKNNETFGSPAATNLYYGGQSDYSTDTPKSNGNFKHDSCIQPGRTASNASLCPAMTNFRQSRILSPEPDMTYTSGAPTSPMALRTYNRQSRSYYHSNNVHNNDNKNGNVDHHQIAENNNNNIVPLFSYTEKLSRSRATSSPLFNIEAFASVRRPKSHSQKIINKLAVTKNSGGSFSQNRITDIQSNMESQNKTHITVENSRDLYNNISILPPRKCVRIQSQTAKKIKEASTCTDDQPSPKRLTVDIGVNTIHDDALKLKEKASHQKLLLEFQYCIGHEPEHPVEGKNFNQNASIRTFTDKTVETAQNETRTQRQQTDVPRLSNQSTNTDHIMTTKRTIKTQATDAPNDLLQRESVAIQTVIEIDDSFSQTENTKTISTSATQTDKAIEEQWLDEIFAKKWAEKQLSDILTQKENKEKDEVASEFILVTCSKCDQSSLETSSALSIGEIYEKIPNLELNNTHVPINNISSTLIMSMIDSATAAVVKNGRRNSAPAIPTNEILIAGSKLPNDIEKRRTLSTVSQSLNGFSHTTSHIKSNDNDISVDKNTNETKNYQSDMIMITREQSLECIQADSRLDTLTINSDEKEPDVELDQISIDTDVQTIVAAGYKKNASHSPSSTSTISDCTIELDHRLLDPSSTEAIRKLLTDPQAILTTGKSDDNTVFRRDANSNRSYRMERSKSSDLDYIADKHISKSNSRAEPSTPSSVAGLTHDTGLKEMVVLKKIPVPSSAPFDTPLIHQASGRPPPPSTTYNVTARIPRPKYFTKYSTTTDSSQTPETPDEEAEADDHLPPLRSEMRSLSAWGTSCHYITPYKAIHMSQSNRYHPSHSDYSDDEQIVFQEQDFFDENDDEELEEVDELCRHAECSSSADDGTQSDATYEMSETESGETNAVYFEGETEISAIKLSVTLLDALITLNTAIGSDSMTSNTFVSQSLTSDVEWATKLVRHEWLKLSTKRLANARLIDAFLNYISDQFSTNLMKYLVNLTDQNGNTALHYAVSHENYHIVSVLLDTKACNVDTMNKAGYSAIMLGALCDIHNGTESAIIHRLFHVGNINAKAVKHSQTALMLAASHGRIETTELLLNCGADVNLQDVDGSTALMCAAEHGQKEIVKLLLKQPSIDASLTDCDNQTALSIAVENQHRDIGVIIYAHLNFSRLEQNENFVVT